jgi:hypothetical protein
VVAAHAAHGGGAIVGAGRRHVWAGEARCGEIDGWSVKPVDECIEEKSGRLNRPQTCEAAASRCGLHGRAR